MFFVRKQQPNFKISKLIWYVLLSFLFACFFLLSSFYLSRATVLALNKDLSFEHKKSSSFLKTFYQKDYLISQEGLYRLEANSKEQQRTKIDKSFKIYIAEEQFDYQQNGLEFLKARVLVPSKQSFFLELKPQINGIKLDKNSSVIFISQEKELTLSIQKL